MFDTFQIASIQPPELVERVLVPNSLSFVPRLLLAGVLCVTPFFFVYDLHGMWWLLAIFLWATGLILGWWAVLDWSRSMVIFTNQRVIGPLSGHWFKRMGEFPRATLQDTRWQPLSGPGGWLGFGRATFIGGASKSVITLAWCRGTQVTIGLSLGERRRLLQQKIVSCDETRLAELETWFAKHE